VALPWCAPVSSSSSFRYSRGHGLTEWSILALETGMKRAASRNRQSDCTTSVAANAFSAIRTGLLSPSKSPLRGGRGSFWLAFWFPMAKVAQV
jgi:hypothetical protein